MDTLKIKIKGENIPSYAKDGDAGLDLIATSIKVVDNKEFGYIEYGTGLQLEIPYGYVGLIYPRSSISNTGLILSNGVGVIDSGYRGEIKVRFKYIKDTKTYSVGEKIAQLIIIPYPKIEFEKVDELSETDRGDNGFGSTGK
jgi:dUTP pyrophosphatase